MNLHFSVCSRTRSSFIYVVCISLFLWVPWSCDSGGDAEAPFFLKSIYVGDVFVDKKDTVEVDQVRPWIILKLSEPVLTSSLRTADFSLAEYGDPSTLLPFSVGVQPGTLNATIRVLPSADFEKGRWYRFEMSSRLKSTMGKSLAGAVRVLYMRLKALPSQPEAPSHLMFSEVSKTEVKLSWAHHGNFGSDPSTGVAYSRPTSSPFLVQVLEGNTYVTLPTASVSATVDYDQHTASISGLTPWTSYSFRVGVVNAFPDTSWSAVATVKTLSAETAPARGKHISRRTFTDESLEIEWAAPSSPGLKSDGSPSVLSQDAYTVTYAKQRTGTYSDANISIKQTERTALVTGLAKGETYYFIVTAKNEENLSSSDTAGPFSTVDPKKPVLPTDVKSSDVTGGGMTLSWTPITDFGKDATKHKTYGHGNPPYVVQLCKDGKCENLPKDNITAVVDPQTGKATLTGLTPNTPYSFRVGAINDNVPPDTSWSENFSVSTTAAEVPGKVTDVKVTTKTETTLGLVWTAPSSFGKDKGGNDLSTGIYKVAYAPKKDGIYTDVVATAIDQTARTATLSGLTVGASYVVVVRVTNAEGLSSSDTAGPFSTVDPKKPVLPTDVKSSDVTGGGVTLSWTPITDFGKDATTNKTYGPGNPPYVVQLCKDGKCENLPKDNITAVVDPQTGKATLTGLTPNTPYSFRVGAINDNVPPDTSWSENFSVSTNAAEAPKKEKNIKKLSATKSSIKVYWTQADFGKKADGSPSAKATTNPYVVTYSGDNKATWLSRNLTIQDDTATVTGLDEKKTYYFRMVATNTEGLASADTSVAFSLDLKTPPVVEKPKATVVKSDSVTLAWAQVAYGKKSDGSSDASPASVRPLYVQVAEVVNNVLGAWQLATTYPTSLGATATTAVVIRLKPNSVYQFRLVAKNEQNDSTIGASSGNVATQKMSLASVAYVGTNGAVANRKSLTYGGSADSSVLPTLNPVDATVTYSLSAKQSSTTSAVPAEITLGKDGRIRIANTILSGTYYLTVTATGTGNYGSSKTTDYTVTVNKKPLTDLRYTQAASSATSTPSVGTIRVLINQAITRLRPVVSPQEASGEVTYSVSPTLPAGLSLNTTTGEVSGTPTAADDSKTYTLTATAKSGSQFSKSVSANLVILRSYPLSDVTIDAPKTKVEVQESIVYTITRAPAGTSMDVFLDEGGVLKPLDNGTMFPRRIGYTGRVFEPEGKIGSQIAGRSEQVFAKRTYNLVFVGRNSTTDTVRRTISLEVTAAKLKELTMSDIAVPIGYRFSKKPILTTKSENLEGASGITFKLTPSTLPAGLSFDATTGTISGSATTEYTGTYTLEATGSGNYAGTLSKTFQLRVTRFGYNRARYVEALNLSTRIAPIVATAGSSLPTSYAISPALPAGLSFNTSTGTISGAPTVVSSALYTVTGTYAGGGTATARLTLETRDVSTFALPNDYNRPYESTKGTGNRYDVVGKYGKATSATPTTAYWRYWGVDEDELAEVLSHLNEIEFKMYAVDRRGFGTIGNPPSKLVSGTANQEGGWLPMTFEGKVIGAATYTSSDGTTDRTVWQLHVSVGKIDATTGAWAIWDYTVLDGASLYNEIRATTGIALRKK